jgi:hypothetical protein
VQQARELWALVYGWLTEGFDTCDLKEAKALLVELAKVFVRRSELATSSVILRPAMMPSAYGGRDEEAIRSRRRTNKMATAQDAEAHAP